MESVHDRTDFENLRDDLGLDLHEEYAFYEHLSDLLLLSAQMPAFGARKLREVIRAIDDTHVYYKLHDTPKIKLIDHATVHFLMSPTRAFDCARNMKQDYDYLEVSFVDDHIEAHCTA